VAIWRNLKHPNIAQLLGIVAYGDARCAISPALVLPRIQNGNVRDYMTSLYKNGDPHHVLSKTVVHKWMFQTALALQYLHSEDVVHGDLRGNNVLIDSDNSVRLTDFGMSVYASGSAGQQLSSAPSASPWMPPEMLDGRTYGRQKKSADIWAFGCLCVELYTNQDPLSEITEDRGLVQALRRYPQHIQWRMLIVDQRIRPTRPQFHGGDLMRTSLWDLVHDHCWNSHSPNERPSAGALVRTIQRYEPGWH